MIIIRNLALTSIVCFFILSRSENGLITSEEELIITETLTLNTEVTKSDNIINTASLPQSILDHITANYPNVMVKAETESNGNYEEALENNVELILRI